VSLIARLKTPLVNSVKIGEIANRISGANWEMPRLRSFEPPEAVADSAMATVAP
jgi:hypothetical protein